MLDKVIIKATVDVEDIPTIALKNYLEECSEGDEVFYRSTAYANFDGCHIEVRGNQLKCRCSICKLWSKEHTGKLENSRPMTMANAVRTINTLLLRLMVKPENAWVTYYEIGLTMKMSRPADEYINEVLDIKERIMWNDANYPVNQQKTTEKSKYFRKIMKIYNKTYEAEEKRRVVEKNVLRIETIYRHQKVALVELMSSMYLRKMARIFWEDWTQLRFRRNIRPKEGVRLGQIERAKEIFEIGKEEYLQKYRKEYADGLLTKKRWETIRTFAKHWETNKEMFVEEQTEYEKEYLDKILKGYQIGIVTLCCKNK